MTLTDILFKEVVILDRTKPVNLKATLKNLSVENPKHLFRRSLHSL
jgi:hypothetical protein